METTHSVRSGSVGGCRMGRMSKVSKVSKVGDT